MTAVRRAVCVGGGPGGLYAALLLKRAEPARDIIVIDRNPLDATYGWGVVFSDETLGFLRDADEPTYREIERHFVHWEVIETRYRGHVIRSGGNAFSGLGRHRLLNILQNRCRELGVHLLPEREAGSAEEIDADLIVAADGVNSRIRAAHQDVFRPSLETHSTKFIWLGAHLPLDAFTFFFRESPYGLFTVHSYPFDRDTSTFIVECTESTWRAAGLDRADEAESLALCEELFAEELGGRTLLSNRSSWINFVTLRNQTWHHGRIALLGDAAHTAHFSVGSGTKMAMEDAIALAAALDRHPRDLERALVEYEEMRLPPVERTQMAALESLRWFENVSRYGRFEPDQFGFSLLTRSRRITYDSLRVRDPDFSREVDRWFARLSGSPEFPPPAPILNPIRLAGIELSNRVVASLPAPEEDENGLPGDPLAAQLAHLARCGAGLVLTDIVAVSPEGRRSPGTAGLYSPEQARAWSRIVDEIHAAGAKVALRLAHAGRRGAMCPRCQGVDRPLGTRGWTVIAPSPLPYLPDGPAPQEMDRNDLRRVCAAFVCAARLAAEIEVDMLEIDCAGGYLLASFLSPLANRRADGYGGSPRNRLQFPLEVVEAVRAVWPTARPLTARVCADDCAPGGISAQEAVAQARALARAGCDLIHVTAGFTVARSAPTYGRLWLAPLADQIRNEADVRVMAAGGLESADEMNTLLAAGRADLCVMAPRLLLDPPWMRRPAPPEGVASRAR